jgi:hypothetical protein
MDTQANAAICTLQGSELLARVEAWKQIVNRATSRRTEGDRILATYQNDPALLRRLRDLIEAEAACCSFLEFSIEERRDDIRTELRLPKELPDSMKAMILTLVGGDGERGHGMGRGSDD